MSKRKRSEDVALAEAPASKKQAIETTESKASASERRQQRSERKSKKAQSAKENARAKKQARKNPEELLPNTNAKDDSFAGGDDFVSLNDVTNTAPTPSLSAEHPKVPASIPTEKSAKPKRKSPRSERKALKAAKAQTAALEEFSAAALPETSADASAAPPKSKKPKDQEQKDTPQTRFIVFVGNLPYTTTTPQIQSHFRKLAPSSIRHSTDKISGKSKGFAFLEFSDYSAMKTCLKVYHHSIFDPERTSKLPDSAFDENGLEIGGPGEGSRGKTRGRKINVELTVGGGGGKSEGRKKKIEEKNLKLFEERERRKKEEMKKEKGRPRKAEMSGANSTEIGSEAVHPSRLKRVKQ